MTSRRRSCWSLSSPLLLSSRLLLAPDACPLSRMGRSSTVRLPLARPPARQSSSPLCRSSHRPPPCRVVRPVAIVAANRNAVLRYHVEPIVWPNVVALQKLSLPPTPLTAAIATVAAAAAAATVPAATTSCRSALFFIRGRPSRQHDQGRLASRAGSGYISRAYQCATLASY